MLFLIMYVHSIDILKFSRFAILILNFSSVNTYPFLELELEFTFKPL